MKAKATESGEAALVWTRHHQEEVGPRAFLPTQAHPPLLFPQRLCQGHHSQVKRSSETSRGVTRAQTAQILFTKKEESRPGCLHLS